MRCSWGRAGKYRLCSCKQRNHLITRCFTDQNIIAMIEIKMLQNRLKVKLSCMTFLRPFTPEKRIWSSDKADQGKPYWWNRLSDYYIQNPDKYYMTAKIYYKWSGAQFKALRSEIGMLFQGSALFDSLTVIENVMFPLKMFTRKSLAERIKRAEFCLDRVNLKGANDLFPSEISGGMQKRVAIARAIALNQNIYFVTSLIPD